MPRKIEVVPYDPQWAERYEVEAQKLEKIFGSALIAIHHIGSTAIPGVKAKPIIDSLIVIKDIRKVAEFDQGMIQLGYRPRGECLENLGTLGRFYYSKNTDGVRTHQAHVCEIGHHEIEEKLNFRDFLRVHPAEAETYSALKEKLAQENTGGIVEYIKGKDGFIKQIAGRARMWRASVS
jgi:GrpB-like predicted nucleotidyltransferase (UPF0157 family)